MDAALGVFLFMALAWFIHVTYLRDKISQLSYSLERASVSWFDPEKKALYRAIYFARMYNKAMVYNKELLLVIKELWRDSRISPMKMQRPLDSIMEEYEQERHLLSRKWEEVKLPVIKMEDVLKEEMILANDFKIYE